MSNPPIEQLVRLAKKGVRINLQPEGWEEALPLRLWRATPQRLTLKLERRRDAPPEKPLREKQEVWGVMENRGRVQTFRSTLLELIRDDTGRLVALACATPDVISTNDRRRAFRVPKIPIGVLQAVLERGDHTWEVRVCNLSVLGASLELPAELADSFDEDAPYSLRLITDELEARMGARFVRHTKASRISVRFPSALRLGEVSPPPSLARIVRICELSWLRHRNGIGRAA